MLEIVFSNGRIGAKIVKIIGVAEGAKINSDLLAKEDVALIKKQAADCRFDGKLGRVMETYGKSGRILVIGLGKKPAELSLQNAGGALASKLFNDEVAAYYVEKIKGCNLNEEQIAHNLAFGLLLGTYRFDKYFTTKKPEEYPNLERVIFKVKNPAEVNENFKNYAALANAVRYGRDLCNEPANYLTPEVFADDIKRLE